MEDMLELANEVQETLGRAYGLPEDVDEDDLEAGMKIDASGVLHIHVFLFIISLVLLELDALGDDILMDKDTSYLDSATIPDPLNTVPQTTGGQTNVSTMCRVLVVLLLLLLLFRMACCWMSLVYLKSLIYKKYYITHSMYCLLWTIQCVVYTLHHCLKKKIIFMNTTDGSAYWNW